MRANHLHSIQKAQWAWQAYINHQDNPIDMPIGKCDVGNAFLKALLSDESRLGNINSCSSLIPSLLTLESLLFLSHYPLLLS